AGPIYRVIARPLGEAEYRPAPYSIADTATYPWLVSHANQGQNLDDFPSLKRWFEGMRARPAVQRGYAVMAEEAAQARAAAREPRKVDQETWNNLFGSKQHERR